jgi:F-type H+-transporting ATPase subunit delta
VKAKEHGKVAVRYARALFEIVSDENVDGVNETLLSLVTAWNESIELRHALLNPAVAVTERIAVLRDLVSGAEHGDILGNFLAVLLENGRLDAIEEVQEAFAGLLAAKKNLLALTVTSAFPLQEQERTEILEKAQKECGRLVSIVWLVDESLIGGLSIQAGDRVLDNSVRSSLEKMRATLAR